MKYLISLFAVLLLSSCIAPAPHPTPPAPRPTPPPTVQPALERGIAFIESQFNPDLGLLEESPEIGKGVYYLTNDNALAVRVLDYVGGDKGILMALNQSLAKYGISGNGFIDVAWGDSIRWPPYHHEDITREEGEGFTMLEEVHRGPGYFYDWSAYSNLACMAVVNEFYEGNTQAARRLLEIEVSTFDGFGFPDLAYDKRGRVYETLGLTWCLYAGALLDMPDGRILNALLRQQGEHGGFHTHFTAIEPQLADPNIETTSMAVLPLWTMVNGNPEKGGRIGLTEGTKP